MRFDKQLRNCLKLLKNKWLLEKIGLNLYAKSFFFMHLPFFKTRLILTISPRLC